MYHRNPGSVKGGYTRNEEEGFQQMKNIKLISISGPAHSGKTLLIEHLLRSNRKRNLAAIRMRLRDDCEESFMAEGNTETTRYRQAGADFATAVTVPDSMAERIPDIVWQETNFEHALLLEVDDNYLPDCDLRVLVIRPLAADESLVSKVIEPVLRIPLASLLSSYNDQSEEDFDPEEDEHDFQMEISDEEAEKLVQFATSGVPIKQERFKLHPDLNGLFQFEAIIINIHNPEELPGARMFERKLERILADDNIYHNLGYLRHRARRPSIFIANLGLSASSELRKILARIKRILPPVRDDEDDFWF